jgi:hypothetical protein
MGGLPFSCGPSDVGAAEGTRICQSNCVLVCVCGVCVCACVCVCFCVCFCGGGVRVCMCVCACEARHYEPRYL